MRHRTREQCQRDNGARRALIAEAAREAVPFPEIAAKFGISVNRVRQICRTEGVTMGRGGEAGSFAVRREMYRRIAGAARRGATQREVAAEFKVSVWTVVKACKEFDANCKRGPNPHRVRMLEERRGFAERLRNAHPATTPSDAISRRFDHPPTRAIARMLLSTDLSALEIARRQGVAPQWVQRVWAMLRDSIGKPKPRRGRPSSTPPSSPQTPQR